MGFKRTVSVLVFIVFIIISVLSILNSFDTDSYEQYANQTELGETETQVETEIQAVTETQVMTETQEEIVTPDDILIDHPFIVVAAGIILTFAVMMMKDHSRTAFLVIYMLFIVLMTLGFREMGYSRGRFEVFWSYKQFFTSDRIRLEILYNIWLFVPLGAVLYIPGDKFMWVLATLLAFMIELIQFDTGMGLCEFDDVISNTLGALIGYMFSYGMMNNGSALNDE